MKTVVLYNGVSAVEVVQRRRKSKHNYRWNGELVYGLKVLEDKIVAYEAEPVSIKKLTEI